MKIFKKSIKEKKEEQLIQKKTDLEEICGDDREIYEALKDTIFLDPKKVGITMEEAEQRAKESEEAGDSIKTRINYQIALGLAIWEGNVKEVIKFAKELRKFSGAEHPILKNPEKAVEKAQQYYRKYQKPEEKKEEKKEEEK